MVFLHNGGGDHGIWHYQLEYFAANYSVYALDLLGFGESDRPVIPYTLPLYLDLLAAFLAEKKLTRVILVGNCVGASTALEFSRCHPEQVDALILFHVCGGRPMLRGFLRYLSGLLRSSRWLQRVVTPLLSQIYQHDWVQARHLNFILRRKLPPTDPALIRFLNHNRRPLQIQSRLCLNQGLDSFDTFSSPLVRPENFPATLLIWGDHNRVLRPIFGRKLAASLQPTSWIEIVDCGHMPMFEVPHEVNSAMSRFLSDLAIPPPKKC
jgi:pimeloyl-ACP methyl ester carboxylesterase